jgi:alpha-beta hydrolase superfamily lysophospholipase
MPTIFLVAGDDSIADPVASAKLFGSVAAKDKTLIEYPDMLHALSLDLGRENVFRDILNWAEQRL